MAEPRICVKCCVYSDHFFGGGNVCYDCNEPKAKYRKESSKVKYRYSEQKKIDDREYQKKKREQRTIMALQKVL